MKTESKTVRVIPYGRLTEWSDTFGNSTVTHPLRVSRTWKRFRHEHDLWHLLVAFSDELDDVFARAFREKATADTRLLVLNDSRSSDRLLSRMVDLQIRSPHRFYVADRPFSRTNERKWEDLILSLLARLTAALESRESDGRILDAHLEDGILNIVSADFTRLEVPVSRIEQLAQADMESAGNFQIDDDGSYIYWADLELHLGWEQLQQVVDPLAVRKAKQKSREFNERYGAAIRKLRQQKGLTLSEIPEISEKQLRRIERGDCRLTSNAAGKLAAAHGMDPNEYLQAVATALN
jgi:hypothetical protein